jgi:hypothetical protein
MSSGSLTLVEFLDITSGIEKRGPRRVLRIGRWVLGGGCSLPCSACWLLSIGCCLLAIPNCILPIEERLEVSCGHTRIFAVQRNGLLVVVAIPEVTGESIEPVSKSLSNCRTCPAMLTPLLFGMFAAASFLAALSDCTYGYFHCTYGYFHCTYGCFHCTYGWGANNRHTTPISANSSRWPEQQQQHRKRQR